MTTQTREYVNFTTTEEVATAFLAIVNPKQFTKDGKPTGDPRYSGTFNFPKDSADLKALKALVADSLKKANPGKQLVSKRLTQEQVDAGAVEVKLPWEDGDAFADKGEKQATPRDNKWARGHVLVKTGSDDKHPPALSKLEKDPKTGVQKVVELNEPAARQGAAGLFKDGCFCAVQFGLNIYPAKGDKPGGCSLWPRTVMFVKSGPVTTGGGGVNQAEVFRAYVGQVKSEDPTAGVEDEF